MDGCLAPIAGHLGVARQPVAVEHADRAGREVEARTLPIGDDVGLLDLDHPDVGELLGGRHLEHGGEVAGPQRPVDESFDELHVAIEADGSVRPGYPLANAPSVGEVVDAVADPVEEALLDDRLEHEPSDDSDHERSPRRS